MTKKGHQQINNKKLEKLAGIQGEVYEVWLKVNMFDLSSAWELIFTKSLKMPLISVKIQSVSI